MNLKAQYESFRQLRDQSHNLAQELRHAAAQILEHSPEPDECPLCHTQFAPGDLAKHISVGLDQNLEARGQTLLTQLQKREVTVRDAIAVERVVAWLRGFCERAALGSGISFSLAMTEIENAKEALAAAQSRFQALDAEVTALEAQGFP